MDVELRLAGVPAWSFAQVRDLEWSETADRGCESASWSMPDLALGVAHPLLRVNTAVDLLLGGVPIWAGVLSEPDYAASTFHARGLAAQADQVAAITATTATDPGATTSNAHTAISAAATRGPLSMWRYSSQLSGVAASKPADATRELNSLGALLDAVANREAKRWGLDGRREFYWRADPTTPLWALTPGSAVMGRADDDYVSRVYARYATAVDSGGDPTSWANVVAGASPGLPGDRERVVDLTTLGVLTSAQASTEATGQYARDGARMGYTNGVEATPLTLTTLGGTPVDVRLVRAGQMVRLHGVATQYGVQRFAAFHDFVIDRISCRDGESLVQITPVGLAARSFGEVIAKAATRDEVFAG